MKRFFRQPEATEIKTPASMKMFEIVCCQTGMQLKKIKVLAENPRDAVEQAMREINWQEQPEQLHRIEINVSLARAIVL